MATTKTLRNRGAQVVLEVHGEALFLPDGDVAEFKRKLSNRVRNHASRFAPMNSRPRWFHNGVPLKRTFTANTRTRQTAKGGFVYSGIASRARHALFVDQGTGIHGGNGPYRAKVLPPWQVGSASLYEHTWSPSGPEGRQVAPVMIKGQQGQFFMQRGLEAGLRAMRQPTVAVPGISGYKSRGIEKLTEALIPGPLSNNGGDPRFVAQLEEWRAWRDEAWTSKKPRRPLGENNAAALVREQRRRQVNRDHGAANSERVLRERAASKTAKATVRKRKSRANLKKIEMRKPERKDLRFRMVSSEQKAAVKRRLADALEKKHKYVQIKITDVGSDGTYSGWAKKSATGPWIPLAGRWRK